MNANDTPIKSPRRWPLRLWIVVPSLLFPAVAALWAGALAEALLGDMEPMFIVGGTFVIAAAVALVSGTALMAMSSVLHSRLLRVLLIGISIFEVVSIPLCQGIVAWGRHQRERRFAPITSARNHPNESNAKGEQNGCRQRLEGYLSCQQRPPLAVA